MTFIAMDTDLEEDPRLHILTSTRKWSRDYAIAFMFRFLRAVRRGAATDGDVTTWTNEFIAAQTETKGKCVGLVDDLLTAGLLVRDGDRIVVERWEELNGKHIRKNLTKADRSAGGTARIRSAERDQFGRLLRRHRPGVDPAGSPGRTPCVAPGLAGPASPPAGPAEPEPQPDPEQKTDSLEPSASGPPHTVFDTVGKPKTFPFSQAEAVVAESVYPGVNVTVELGKMSAWLKANPTRRKTASGMPRFINAWLSRAQNSSPGRADVPVPPAERRRIAKEIAAKRAKELEESRTPIELDAGQAERFDQALEIHRKGCADGASDSPREGGAA